VQRCNLVDGACTWGVWWCGLPGRGVIREELCVLFWRLEDDYDTAGSLFGVFADGHGDCSYEGSDGYE